MGLGARPRAAFDRVDALMRAVIDASRVGGGGVARRSELDPLRVWLSEETIAAAERRARRVGVGADRVLITAGLLDDEIYVRALADALSIAFEPLDEVPRGNCPLDDDRLIATAGTGILPLVQRGPPALVFAPRGTGARRIVSLIAAKPWLTQHLRVTTGERLHQFVTRHTEPAIGGRATRLLSRTRPELSAAPARSRRRLTPLLAAGGLTLSCLAAAPGAFVLATGLVLTFVFAAWATFRFATTLLRGPSQPHPAPPRDDQLPIYTVVVALYREAAALEGLVAALRQLDWPPEKLDIKLVVEPDDWETRKAIGELRLVPPFEVIVAPRSGPRTKPKALNAALPFARGTFTVIYDAEDRPEPDQLRKAFAAFGAGGKKLACAQARLTIDNTADNWLTALFTAEYAAQFDVFLPALAELGLPLPLGGSSNHFRTETLRAIGAWDPYNVTEDADLGLRLARFGHRATIINSTTYEEAPARLGAWLRQRTRWFKGWLQTWLVHMRRPHKLWRELGPAGFLATQLIVGGNVLAALVHPLLVGGVIVALATGAPWASSPMDALFGATAAIGYAMSVWLGFVGLSRRSLLVHAWALLFVPVHWLLLSVAAWRALYQLVRDPYRWEKTEHGLARTSRTPRRVRIDDIIAEILKPPQDVPTAASLNGRPISPASRRYGTTIEKLTSLVRT